MIKYATFAAGCFWGVQEKFSRIPGVLETIVGYTGGSLPNPTYQQVCSHMTGHAEAIQIKFDSNQISYEELLDTFWKLHDPTTKDRQGLDVGSQYRSAIFYHSEEQKEIANESKTAIESHYRSPIVTQIVPATEFYPAEEYHQYYLRKQRG